MWIRTQDKEALVNCSGFSLEKTGYTSSTRNFQETFDIYGVVNNAKICLGREYTKERAIKILNHIQKLLEDILLEKIHLIPVYEIPNE
jgi:hypothetical protein